MYVVVSYMYTIAITDPLVRTTTLRSPHATSRNDPRASLLCAHPRFLHVPQIMPISSTILVHSHPPHKATKQLWILRVYFLFNVHTLVLIDI